MNSKNILTLDEASSILGVPAVTLRGKLNKGEIRGVKIKKGTRDIWGIEQEEIESLIGLAQPMSSYSELFNNWLSAQRTGLINGKIYSEKTIEANVLGIKNFWRYSGLSPNIKHFNAETLIRTLSKYPIDHVKRKCSYTSKEHTKKGMLCFVKFLIIEKLMTRSSLEQFTSVKIRRLYEPRKTKLRQSQIGEFLKAINKVHTIGTYDNSLSKIMVALLVYTGLRKSELLNLTVSDIYLSERFLLVREGKGKKSRKVGLLPEIIADLNKWLQVKQPGLSLITMKNGQGMTRESFRRRFDSIRKKSGMDISPHGLRRTFATIASLKGIPLEIVSKTLGHTDLKTTQGYLMADEEDAIKIFANCKSFFGEPKIDTRKQEKLLQKAMAMGVIMKTLR